MSGGLKLEGEARRAVRALGIPSSPPHVAETVSLTITEDESKF
jgi:hypothetical protein